MEFVIYSLLIIVIFVLGVRIIPQQDIGIVETFGKFSTTLDPGFNWIVPFVQTVRAKVSLRIQEIQTKVEVKTKDNMFVELPVSIMISVESESVAQAYYKLEDPHSQIKTWVLNSVRSISSNMSIEELFTDREHVVNEVKKTMKAKLAEYGFVIETVLIDQPTVSEDVQRSFNRVVAAKRDAEAAQQEGEATKIKAIALANADAESQRIKAQGMADAREILAKGLSESVKALETSDLTAQTVASLLIEMTKLDVLRDVGNKGNLIITDTSKESVQQSLLASLLNKNTGK